MVELACVDMARPPSFPSLARSPSFSTSSIHNRCCIFLATDTHASTNSYFLASAKLEHINKRIQQFKFIPFR
jgi:hypothetical protein